MSRIYWMFFILTQISSDTIVKKLHIAHAAPMQASRVPFSLNPYIRHWEPAHFERNVLEDAHKNHEISRRRKRDINYNNQSPHYGTRNTIEFTIKGHEREFHVKLREDPTSIFSPDFVLENSIGPIDFDISRIYTGSLKDDENSHVYGVLTSDNLFDGTITTRTEQFYIEPSHKYSKSLSENGVHSIIYKLSDVKMNAHNHNNVDPLTSSTDHHLHCASEQLHRRTKRWLNQPEEPPIPLDLETPYNTRINVNEDDYQSDQASPNTNVNRNILINSYNPNSDSNFRNIITKANHNVLTNVFNGSNHPNRINNNFTATNQMNVNSRPNHKTHVEIITKNGPTKKPSNVIINNYNPDLIYANNNPPNKYYPNNQFPHLYHPQHHVNMNNFDMLNLKPTGGSPADRKSTCMLYLQADHTFFQKLGSDEASIESITRHVQRANNIYKNTDFNGDGKPDNITFMIKRIKVHNTNALKDPTYRFPGNYGVEKFLELFSEENYDQFCLAYMFTYRDFEMGTLGLAWTGDLKNAGGVCEKNGHYRGSLKSLNTGIVTLLNYGKHVPPAVSHVTLAHEIGHNFGSPHDPDQCTPGGEDGNFIMFARATSGDKRNNNKFSPCSLKSIEPVLNTKARSSKGCFTEPQPAICGNGVVEEGEQCDCGWEEDCKDDCCYPMSSAQSALACTLKPGARCSPSQGPCCQADCSLNYGAKCRDDNGCRDPSYCNGGSALCPPSKNKANKTICNKEFVCFMGECTGSICLAYGLESCQCIAGERDAKTKSCELCCKMPGENQPCKSSFDWNNAPYDVPDMYSKPGTPCNDYNGYCDVFQRCREVDPSGPLATLRKLLLSEESIASFKKWVIHNWYAVSLIFVAVFAILVLSTKYLGKKSNSKLKTVTIIHSATTETVRLPDDNNGGMIIHTAVRTKVPLKKKVRGERKKKNQLTSSTPKDTVVNAANLTQIVKPIRQIKTQESPRKLLRKKKRRPSSGAVDNNVQEPPKAQRRLKKKTSKAKEVIDYSSPEQHTNTFGKVQKWLLESPIVLSAASQFEHSSKSSTTVMNKSQSTPEHLAVNLQSQSPQQPQRSANVLGGKSKNKSISHVNNKVRLQVVFKPPFKFSLKLSKNDNSNVKTTVASGVNRKRDSRKRNSLEDPVKSSRRAALLIRSATEDIGSKQIDQEPMYETLTRNSTTQRQKSSTLPSSSGGNDYENLPTTSSTANLIDATLNNPTTSPIINTATFRINKSSRNLPVIATPVLSKSQKTSQRGSQQNLNRERRPSGSSSNLMKFGGSSQNLTRSSTTNLTKNARHDQSIKRRASDMNRSSTTNLNKYHRQQSHNSSNSNLRRDGSAMDIVCSSPDDTIVAERKSHSRKNSVNLSKSNSNLAIAGSSSHNPKSGSSRREENFKNNIPRASLINASTIVNAISNNPFKRQTSFNVNVKPTPLSHQSRLMIDELNKNRPQTSSCDSSMFKNFEWPKVLTTQRSLPAENAALQSDMEVMLSDAGGDGS